MAQEKIVTLEQIVIRAGSVLKRRITPINDADGNPLNLPALFPNGAKCTPRKGIGDPPLTTFATSGGGIMLGLGYVDLYKPSSETVDWTAGEYSAEIDFRDSSNDDHALLLLPIKVVPELTDYQ